MRYVVDVGEVIGEDFVEDDLTNASDEVFLRNIRRDAGAKILMDGASGDRDTVMERDNARFISGADLGDAVEDFTFHLFPFEVLFSHLKNGFALEDASLLFFFLRFDRTESIRPILEVLAGLFGGEVEVTKDHVLARNDDGFTIFRAKDVVGSKHQLNGFFLSRVA